MEIYSILKSRQQRQTKRARNRYKDQRGLPTSIGRLRQIKRELAVTSEIFSQEQIWPDQCEYILQTFDGIQQTTDRFVKSITSSSGYMEPIAAKRYSIIADACYFSSQVEKLHGLTREFGAISQRSNSREFKHEEINRSLRQLDLSFNKLMKGIDYLLEDM